MKGRTDFSGSFTVSGTQLHMLEAWLHEPYYGVAH